MSVRRIDVGPRMSQAVVHGNTVYLAGQVAADPKADVTGQTEQILAQIDRLLQILPTAAIAAKAWADYGQVIVCDKNEEMLRAANEIASENVQVMIADPDYFLANMTHYEIGRASWRERG